MFIIKTQEAAMKWQQLIVNAYETMFQELEKVLDGLTAEDLHKRPSPGANPIGWLCWHTIRSCDRLLGDAVLGKQLWISEGWYKKFNRPPDLNDTGFGHTDTQVDALRIPDVKTLLSYEQAVKKALFSYFLGLTEKELDREAATSIKPGTTTAVHLRIVGALNNLQHVGQAGYVRGLIKGHGWYGR
jgi:hypothetical protein